MRPISLVVAFLAASACRAFAQSTDSPVRHCWSDFIAADSARSADLLGRRRIAATRLSGAAPRIDGRLDDAAWCQRGPDAIAAAVAVNFSQSRPVPSAASTLRAEARVLYDDAAIYVAVRLYDSAPDSVLAPLLRRDDEGQSDWVFAEFDSRHDRRTSFAFGLNPRGVQADGMYFDDRSYDSAWDGVWDGAVQRDSLGWTAEFRIPLSQLPYDPAEHVWGFNIYRFTPHRAETSNWSPRAPTHPGIASIYNELVIDGLTSTGIPLEVVPYAAANVGSAVNGVAHGASVGLDVRARVTPGLQLTTAVHPDFGQVEADPSLVNLSEFQTFFPEQRPLFVQGADIFAFGQPFFFVTRDLSFGNDATFYSRRIGRAPRGTIPDSTTLISKAGASPILGAAKLTGRVGDWSVGVLDAWTGSDDARVRTPSGTQFEYPVEPLTHFAVTRLVNSLDHGERALGTFVSFVQRPTLSPVLGPLMPRDAAVGGFDGRSRFSNARYEVSGSIVGSRVVGADWKTGVMADARVGRVAGDLTWSAGAHVISPKFDMNEVGFSRSADWILATGTIYYQHFIPTGLFRRVALGSTSSGLGWNSAGERRAAVLNATSGADFRNFSGTGVTITHDFPSLATEALRGGPALLLPPRTTFTFDVYSDQRRATRARLDASLRAEPGTGSRAWSVAPSIDARLSSALELAIAPSASYAVAGWQYVAQPTDSAGARHYIVGHLSEPTAALTVQGTMAVSPKLSVQLYAQPFVSTGHFNRLGEVTHPRAADPGDRITWFDISRPSPVRFANPDFSERDFNSNVVVRWEFRPGSSLFVVWTQQRHDSVLEDFALGRDTRRLFAVPGANVFAIKATYWIRA